MEVVRSHTVVFQQCNEALRLRTLAAAVNAGECNDLHTTSIHDYGVRGILGHMTQIQKTPRVLYVTRPLCPPWDEASKNFAHDLAKHVAPTAAAITVMTHGRVDDLPPHVHQAAMYSRCPFTLRQKAEAFAYQWRVRGQYDIAHYFFTPARANAFAVTHFLRHRRTRTVQTIATLRDDVMSAADFRRVLYGDRLVTYTRYAARVLEQMGFAHVSQAYPGIDLAHFRPLPPDSDVRAHFAIAPTHRVVMYPGEYVRLGATDTILAAMRAFWRSDAPDAARTILLLALRVKNRADAEKKNAVQAALARAGFADRVRYTDTFADMRALYNLADVVLFPVANMHGKFDVPLALVEAYACGRPVIVSDIPRLREFTNPSISAIIEAGDAAALTVAIDRLLRDRALARTMGEAARAFAAAHFDIHKTAQFYEELYQSLR